MVSNLELSVYASVGSANTMNKLSLAGMELCGGMEPVEGL